MTNNRKEYFQQYHIKNKEKQNAYALEYRKKNRDRLIKLGHNWRIKTKNDYFRHEAERILAYNILGNQCVICGNKDSWVLEIDHIIPLRNEKIHRGRTTYDEILNGNLKNVQLLCANCHKRKTIMETIHGWRLFSLD